VVRTGPPPQPDINAQHGQLNQLPKEKINTIPSSLNNKSLPQMAPMASVHVNVPHQQFTEYQHSLNKLSPGQSNQRQRMNQMMMQNNMFNQQAQQKGGIAITG